MLILLMLAPNSPALCTPTPFSVPTMRIEPAYIPPNCETSIDTSGLSLELVSSKGSTVWLSWLTLFFPVTTLSSFAQIAELTDTVWEIKSV